MIDGTCRPRFTGYADPLSPWFVVTIDGYQIPDLVCRRNYDGTWKVVTRNGPETNATALEIKEYAVRVRGWQCNADSEVLFHRLSTHEGGK